MLEFATKSIDSARHQSSVKVNEDGSSDSDTVETNVGTLLNAGSGTFPPQITFPSGLGPDHVKVVDINPDNTSDLVVTNFDPHNE